MREVLKCPKCPDERLVRGLGNVAICPSCDWIIVEVGKGAEVVPIVNADPGDDSDYLDAA